ncbi:MAG: erythromycin esterase family protein [Bacteroidales bacterium]|jgi:erythromycin esterase|nr:erythromycin esterase family protein [Bacteroidales bacterium]
MKNPLLLLLLLSFLTLQSHSQVQVKIGKSTEIIYPVTPNETNDLDELIPLGCMLRDKKVVGMGEATHGTREFFNMKAKMFKFLVTYCGYRILAIEATFGGTLKVNDYVLYGKGNVLSAMKGMEFWTWDTEEVKDLIEWIRTYNDGKPDKEKLKFYGFDCQSFKGPADALVDYVKEFDKQNPDEFLKGLSVLNDSSYLYFYTLKPDKSSQQGISQIHGIISFLQTWFQGKENSYISAGGRTKFELARHNIEVLKQALLLRESSEKKYGFRRDSSMAQNVRWIYELEHQEVFAWAHNAHISNNAKYYFNKDKTMGAYLNDIFGETYFNIGFVFNQGSFQAYNKVGGKLQEFIVPENKKNTLAIGLSHTGIDAFFIDLTSTNNKMFQNSKQAYSIGAVFIPEHWYMFAQVITAKQQFDGLIFINKTTCAIPIIRKSTN